jgi:hypothetical protein
MRRTKLTNLEVLRMPVTQDVLLTWYLRILLLLAMGVTLLLIQVLQNRRRNRLLAQMTVELGRILGALPTAIFPAGQRAGGSKY